ncbi:PucR family transcriptional regulator ligand-binding domain-containing protein [Bacillus sp. EB106-08-02-XG196]|uniref:PucR family transcriptional regulator n=1 Tax=Bacillus sp. EB106-08-02-XG196 TaxID=2737049 RepID=UPI0015C4D32C|nr:PucR family transcriptional regulator [Bacillus sp. EB106-08-02-XG196]NWQ43715.1 PucR family transcriptional regulator ligand-binding domain-containing protein [Bacillus sp. EB106-08-02-XG196]
MNDHLPLTVSDILSRKHFEQAIMIAGEEGLNRIVKWVHVVEVTNIRNLLNGDELILSTGVAWKGNEDLFVSILNQLIEIHAAGLCIEMGTYLSEIPAEAIRIANQNNFPIVIFQKEVPFVEITQDIHTMIIHKQYRKISDLRKLFIEEKKRAEENEWLQGWLEGEHTLDSIHDYLHGYGIKLKSPEAVVLLAKVHTFKEKSNQDVTYIKLLFQSVFEQNGFAIFSVEKRNELIVILLNNRPNKNVKERIKKAIEAIEDSEFLRKKNTSKIFMAAGKFVDRLTDIHKSSLTAKETLRIQQEMAKEKTYFYEDLHLYRLISQMSRHMDLQELVMEYLQPVIHHDQTYNSKLLETLKVYLECNGSKQETANKLFIVRQTLYHRLQKLENLLGKDFMNHEKRVAFEFMLLVKDYLSPHILESKKQLME